MIEVLDAIDRQVRLPSPARRIVSLVPSETLSVVDLVGLEALVGRTDYCVEPRGRIETVPSIGGTKSFDVDAVLALEPDLVLANKEENGRKLVESLLAAGAPVHVSFPCTVDASLEYLVSLCRLLGLDPDEAPPLQACRTAVARARETRKSHLPVFVPIWKDPWMTFDERAYASDVLDVCGAANVFAGRARRYPLAADLGRAAPARGKRTAERDTRYPRIRLEEIVERGARAALLPNEPYAFSESDAAELEALDAPHPILTALVDGMDLFWYGTHVARAVTRLSDEVARVRKSCFGSAANN